MNFIETATRIFDIKQIKSKYITKNSIKRNRDDGGSKSYKLYK